MLLLETTDRERVRTITFDHNLLLQWLELSNYSSCCERSTLIVLQLLHIQKHKAQKLITFPS
jgi:hypothetical protein